MTALVPYIRENGVSWSTFPWMIQASFWARLGLACVMNSLYHFHENNTRRNGKDSSYLSMKAFTLFLVNCLPLFVAISFGKQNWHTMFFDKKFMTYSSQILLNAFDSLAWRQHVRISWTSNTFHTFESVLYYMIR